MFYFSSEQTQNNLIRLHRNRETLDEGGVFGSRVLKGRRGEEVWGHKRTGAKVKCSWFVHIT